MIVGKRRSFAPPVEENHKADETAAGAGGRIDAVQLKFMAVARHAAPQSINRSPVHDKTSLQARPPQAFR
jgi:hypothetical protein